MKRAMWLLLVQICLFTHYKLTVAIPLSPVLPRLLSPPLPLSVKVCGKVNKQTRFDTLFHVSCRVSQLGRGIIKSNHDHISFLHCVSQPLSIKLTGLTNPFCRLAI